MRNALVVKVQARKTGGCAEGLQLYPKISRLMPAEESLVEWETRHQNPDPAHLKTIDMLVFDLQDA